MHGILQHVGQFDHINVSLLPLRLVLPPLGLKHFSAMLHVLIFTRCVDQDVIHVGSGKGRPYNTLSIRSWKEMGAPDKLKGILQNWYSPRP